MIQILANVLGLEETKATIDGMPPLFRKTARHWIFSERGRYYRIFARKIASQKHNAGAPSMFRRGGKWESRTSGPFNKIVMEDKPNEIMADIGLQARGGGDVSGGFKRRLIMMEESAGDSEMASAGKFMTIPVVKNLEKNAAAQRDISSMALNRRGGAAILRRLIASHSINSVRKGDTIYYFDNDMYKKRGGGFKRSALLFIGKRLVRLRKRFDYVKAWEGRKDAMVDNFVTKVNRLLRNVSRGYLSDD